MVLDFLRAEKVADDLQTSAQHSGPTEVIECENGAYIETLYDERSGEPYYRTCSKGGSICRYSSDLWQAQVYAQYY